jgi:hypothetical protein
MYNIELFSNEVFMDKMSGYVVANDKGGYDVIAKTPQTSKKAFVIPDLDEDVTKTDNAPKADTNKDRNFVVTDYDPFKVAKTGNVKLPEWMLTKTEPKRSDAEILKDIEELAKEHARTGQFQDSDSRFRELMDEYISSVSPDREGILKKSTNEIYERIASEMSGMSAEDATEDTKKKNKELIDFFMQAIGASKGKYDNDIISNIIAARGNNIATGGNAYSNNNIIASRSDGYYTQVDIDRGGGKITSLTYDINGKLTSDMRMKSDMYEVGWVQNGVVKNAFFYDDNGDIVMSYADNHHIKLAQLYTKAEHARLQEIQGVYNAAYDFSVGRYNPHTEYKVTTATMLTNVNGIESGNALRKEIYDSTYERLANSSVA